MAIGPIDGDLFKERIFWTQEYSRLQEAISQAKQRIIEIDREITLRAQAKASGEQDSV